MNITRLLISDIAPLYPSLRGGSKRIWNLFANLSEERFQINYVGIDFSVKKRCRVSLLKPNLREYLVPFPLHYYFWYPFQKLFFSDLGLDLFTYFMMPSVRKFSTLTNNIPADILVSSHPWVASCIKKKKGQIFVYDAHNCEYLLTKILTNGKILGKQISKLVKKIEFEACQKSHAILVCSQQQKFEFIELYKVDKNKVYVIPNGAVIKEDITEKEKQKAKNNLGLEGRKIIFFVGVYYKPNIEAVNFIIKELSCKLKECIFLIAGSVNRAFKEKGIPSNIQFLGLVDEKKMDICFKATDIAINPIFSGSGVNIKLLDYLSYGLPVVTTAFGSRGVKINNEKEALICHDQNFPAAIKKVFEDKDLAFSLSREGKRFVVDNYDWRIISKELEKVLLQLNQSK